MALNLFAPLSEQGKKDVLVEFRAGQMMMRKDGTKMVDADKRKGTIQLKQSPDGVVNFIWKDRTTGTEEIKLMLFPNDAVFKKVDNAKGRVYVLQWLTSDKKLFFWLQEPSEDKDKENVENINKYINNPPAPEASAGLAGLAGLGALGGLGGRGLTPDQLMQLIGGNPEAMEALMGRGLGRGVGGARGGSRGVGSTAPVRPTNSVPSSTSTQTPAPSTPAPTPSTSTSVPTPAVHLDALQRIMNEMVPPALKGPSLKDVINVDEIIASGLFDNPQVVAKLVEFLPEGQVTATNLKENLRSPQFSQAVSMFNQALRTGELRGIMASFGLDTSTIGPNATIEDFLKAIQKKAKEDLKK